MFPTIDDIQLQCECLTGDGAAAVARYSCRCQLAPGVGGGGACEEVTRRCRRSARGQQRARRC